MKMWGVMTKQRETKDSKKRKNLTQSKTQKANQRYFPRHQKEKALLISTNSFWHAVEL